MRWRGDDQGSFQLPFQLHHVSTTAFGDSGSALAFEVHCKANVQNGSERLFYLHSGSQPYIILDSATVRHLYRKAAWLLRSDGCKGRGDTLDRQITPPLCGSVVQQASAQLQNDELL